MTNDEFCDLADALYAALRRYQADMLAAAPAVPQAEPADRCRSIGGPLGAYREGKADAASTLAERIRALGGQR